MYMHDQEHGHIPPPDLPVKPPDPPRKKRFFGIEPPHIVFGALFLVALLVIYLLLLGRRGV
jgi:hypothetical protein